MAERSISKFYLAFFILFAVLIGGVIAVLAFGNWGLSEPQSTIRNLKTIDTSDWKTYVNEQYGFSFKYPKDWEIKVKSENQWLTFDVIPAGWRIKNPSSLYKGWSGWGTFSVYRHPTPTDLSLADWIEQNVEKIEDLPIKLRKINIINADESFEIQNLPAKTICVKNNDRYVYQIVFSQDGWWEGGRDEYGKEWVSQNAGRTFYEVLINKIIPTFKFTDLQNNISKRK